MDDIKGRCGNTKRNCKMQKIQIQTAQWISKLRKKAGKAMLVTEDDPEK